MVNKTCSLHMHTCSQLVTCIFYTVIVIILKIMVFLKLNCDNLGEESGYRK